MSEHSSPQTPAATPTAGTILVEVSAGELVDKISILRVKEEQIEAPEKLAHVRTELRVLEAVRQQALPRTPALQALSAELMAVNKELFAVIDGIYRCEARGDLGPSFVELARSVYRLNDRRALLKRRINLLVGSRLIEEKAHDLVEKPH